MNSKQEQIKQYLEQAFSYLNSNDRKIITESRRQQAYSMFLNTNKSTEDIKHEIDIIRDRLLKEYEELQKQIELMKKTKEKEYLQAEHQAELKRNPNTPIEIKKLNISNMQYEELDKMLFHYTWKSNFYSINENGLQAGIGVNSAGIDKSPSIFFSSGVEAALQTWDVWLKWRLNRINNPLWQGQTAEENKRIQEAFKKGEATPEQYRKYEEWEKEYLSGAYKDNPEILQYLYEYQYEELSHSTYLSFDLKEGADYLLEQVDHKKQNNLANKDNPHSKSYAFFRVMYGDYTDYETDKVDKWNMQTIPGKEITISPSEIAQLTTSDGKDDVWSILNEFYDMYKANVPEEQRTKFDLLDGFMEYTRTKHQEQDLKEEFSLETQELIDKAQYVLNPEEQSNEEVQINYYEEISQQIQTQNTQVQNNDMGQLDSFSNSSPSITNGGRARK